MNHHSIQELRGLKHTVGTGRSDWLTSIGSWTEAGVDDAKSVNSDVRADNLTLQSFLSSGGNYATLCREIGTGSFAAGVLAGKTAVILVPKALESIVNSP
jgi:hypothetical protein